MNKTEQKKNTSIINALIDLELNLEEINLTDKNEIIFCVDICKQISQEIKEWITIQTQKYQNMTETQQQSVQGNKTYEAIDSLKQALNQNDSTCNLLSKSHVLTKEIVSELIMSINETIDILDTMFIYS